MNFCIIFTVLLFSVQDILCRRKDRGHMHGSRIVGGFNTTIEDIPYQVYILIQKGQNHFACGGSIISKNHVLTAAHCVKDATKTEVRTGSTNANSGGTVYTSTNATIHPNYNEKSLDYDVGLVTFSTPIALDSKTQIVKLPKKGEAIESGTPVRVSGWGRTTDGGHTTDTLMVVEIKTLSNDECRKIYGSLTDRMVCAEVPEGGKAPCHGDSGGPMVSKSSKVQLGIVSYHVRGCGFKGYPGVSVRIADPGVRDWIQKNSGV